MFGSEPGLEMYIKIGASLRKKVGPKLLILGDFFTQRHIIANILKRNEL